MAIEHEAFASVGRSGGIDEYRLSENGLQVLLYGESAAPVVTVMVTYRTGSADEGSGRTGAMHFLEHMMFKGTERYCRSHGTSVFDVLQRLGAQVNAATSKDRTNYYAVLPQEYVGLALDIEADRMRGALLSKDDVESERTVILNEMDRADNEPLGNLYRSLWSVAYRAHPYGHPILGWRSDVERISTDVLRDLYDTHYWPDRATVSIIGDFDAAEVLDLTARLFGRIPASARPDTPRTREPEQRGERRFRMHVQGHLAAVMTAYKTPETLHPDTAALDVLAGILAGGKTGRLYRHLTDRGLTAHVSAGSTASRDPGLFAVIAILNPGRTHEEVEEAIEEAAASIRDDGVTDQELQRTRNQLRAAEAFGRDGSYAIAASLNEAISAGDWKLFTTFRERLERVTAGDVQRAARAYLTSLTRTTAWLVPESNGVANEG